MISIIELNIIDACNSRCKFCPRSTIFPTGESMSVSLLTKVIKQIKTAQEQNRIVKNPKIIIGFFGEPLLDNLLIKKARLIKDNIDCFLEMYTNGILLHKYTNEQLSIFDVINISNYGDTALQFNEATGLSIGFTQFDKIKNRIDELPNKRIWDAWRDGKLFDFSSRAGLVNGIAIKKEVRGCAWERDKKYLHIMENGDLILCCQDWKRETKFGNIKEKSISEILKSHRRKDIIDKVNGKKSDLLFICKRCKFSKSGGVLDT
jgi:radical SAM protein with 4Fe4S-binding SPASM domain